MLRLIFGGSGSGKSEYIKDKITESVKADKRVLLIVPEQFSFESEREIYKRLGAQLSGRVSVLSFTRLADMIFRAYGGMAGKIADNTQKLVFMELAVSELRDGFEYYKKAAAYKSFTLRMLNAAEELKNAGVLPEQLVAAAECTADETLVKKSGELRDVYNAYQAILEKSCVDPSDKLERAFERADGRDYFKGCTVFFDEFKSFTGCQFPLIRRIIADSDEVYASLCTDGSGENLFYAVDDTAERLKHIAREAGVKIAAPIILEGQHRFKNSALAAFSRGCFSPSAEKYTDIPDGVRFVTAQTAQSEVAYALSTVCDLVRREGYRYREIAVIPANPDAYLPLIISGMKKYGIPYYTDASEPIGLSPIIKFTSALLRLSWGGIQTDAVFTMLKCGYAPFDEETVARFERYCFLWDIRGGAFKNPFIANPNGFSETFGDQEAEQLNKFNEIRLYILNAAEKLRAADNSTAAQIGRVLFETLTDLAVGVKTEQMISDERTDILTAQKLSRVWEILLEILDSIAVAAGGYRFKLSRYTELFETACGEYQMGTVPQTLDAVTVGAMDRIRMESVRAVFVLGANKGFFPASVSIGGLFSELERKALNDTGLDLSRPFDYMLAEQKFNAYKVLSMPSEKLFVTAAVTDEKGTPLLLSELYKTAEEMFFDDAFVNAGGLPPSYFCKTERTAFETYAENCRKNNVQVSSIRKALDASDKYGGRLSDIERAGNQSNACLSDSGLFPSRLNISPSGLERFYQCKFKFFCSDGLRVSPLRRAKLDPMQTGSLIHYALEALASDKEFLNMGEQQLKKKIRSLLDEYLERVMSGNENKTSQFKYLYSRLNKTVLDIALHLQTELRQSEFYPSDFELKIGSESDVKPLILYAEDGTMVSVAGRIDRVDIAERNGKKFVRVVDYKSGGKTFDLTDVYYGLNLQMLIYLFCIWKNGEGKYNDVLPAGVLYMPAKSAEYSLGREDKESAESAVQRQYKMNGILLNNMDSLLAMEPDLDGVFIPAKIKKDGSFTAASSLATLSEMGQLYGYAQKLFFKMVSGMRSGDVAACPVEDEKGDRFACAWCDYRSVCGVGSDDPGRRMNKLTTESFYEKIGEESADGQKLD